MLHAVQAALNQPGNTNVAFLTDIVNAFNTKSRAKILAEIYSNTDLKMFTNAGASFSNNITYHAKRDWKCPATWLHETGGSCADPHLKDETWHEYGYGDFSRTKAVDKGSSQTEPSPSPGVSHTSIAMKSLGAAILAAGIWGGLRYFHDNGSKG